MFIVQTKSIFGDLICKELEKETDGRPLWQTFEFAVAWVNQLGAKNVEFHARHFLAKAGRIRATVGLDFSSTSYEGLSTLLDLEDGAADITTHVFFDENPSCTFHPKVFLFRNQKDAFLIVGSNNMTGAGLATNIEAALGATVPVDNEVIQAAGQSLEMWRDDEEKRTRRLTREFLEELRNHGYVSTEQEIRERRKSANSSRSTKRKSLFGRSKTGGIKHGIRAVGRKSGGSPSPSGEILLMRVRPRRNGNQLQISMKVLEASFMRGVKKVFSSDGSFRTIGYNVANEVRNTARFEAQEMDGMTNPVARFQWVYSGSSKREKEKILRFEIFDAARSGEGALIFKKLKEGISTPPVTNLAKLCKDFTVLSKSDPDIAQWYRLDSV